MKLCATIAEFNPFHNGHKHLIDTFKDNFDAAIAIMSGNFVQRGESAIFTKFARANAAVANGVDLVIELPVIYALSSAETFASGAIKTLNQTGVIDTLFFGSEEGEIEKLSAIARIGADESEEFKALLQKRLSEGMSYPKALGEIYKSYGFREAIISSPNNILAIEYIRSLIKTNSVMKPATLKRLGAAHDSATASGTIASASHIRSLIKNDECTKVYMPQYTYPAPVFNNSFSNIILYALKSATRDDFIRTPDCSPELASRFIEASKMNSVEDVIKEIKSKNFTESRIRRILWNLVIKNTLSPKTDPTYIRILAQSRRGGEVINHMKKHASLPIVQKGVQLKDDPIFSVEARATDIYNIIANLPSGEDFRHSPIPI